MFDPFQAGLVVGPPIRSRFDDPVLWEAALRIPIGEVVGALDDEEWWEAPPFGIDTLNCCRPFPIAWLDRLASSKSISTCNHHRAADNTHHKAGLIEVVEVAVLDTEFGPHITHKFEPLTNKLRIFTERSGSRMRD